MPPASDDLRARVCAIDHKIHALARGVTGLTAAVYPHGKPGLKIATAAQLYVVQINAAWGAKQSGSMRRPKWIPLAEAKDALMLAGLESMPQLIEAWKAVIAGHEGAGVNAAQKRLDEIEELLRGGAAA